MSVPHHTAEPLNLARRPFANGRPVVRVSVLMGLLGALLLVLNVLSYWRYLEQSEAKRAERDRVSAQREQVERRIGDISRQLASFDLDRQNLQVEFLNRRIAERTFSWSVLLDRLARELPADVRLVSLTPHRGELKGRGRSSAPAAKLGPNGEERIPLEIDGQAKSTAAMLEFVDHLFARPEFADPNPRSQQEDEPGVISFQLDVDYLPEVAAQNSTGVLPSASPVPGGGPTSLGGAPTGTPGGER